MNLMLSISASFGKNNTISATFKVLMPVFLFRRYGAALLAFHLYPRAPSRDVKIWHALRHAFGFQSPGYAWRPCASVWNGKNPYAGVSLSEP